MPPRERKKGGGKAAPSETYHKAVVVHVENKVLAHDGKANQGNVSSAKNGQGVTKQGHARATASMSEETAVTTKKKKKKKSFAKRLRLIGTSRLLFFLFSHTLLPFALP